MDGKNTHQLLLKFFLFYHTLLHGTKSSVPTPQETGCEATHFSPPTGKAPWFGSDGMRNEELFRSLSRLAHAWRSQEVGKWLVSGLYSQNIPFISRL